MLLKFEVEYIDDSGHQHSKVIQAKSEKHAYAGLVQSGFTPVSIKQQNKPGDQFSLFKPKVKASDIENFTTNLASLLTNGVNIDKGLELLTRSAENTAVEELISSIQNDVRGGVALSSSLSKHPQHFDELYIKLVELGESTGTIGEVLKGLSEQLKFRNHMQNQIKQAMAYPSIIVFVCFASLLFILKVVVPQLSTMLDGDKELPAYTKVLLSASDFVNSQYGLMFLALFVGLLVFFVNSNSMTIKKIKIKLLQWFLKAPLVSKLQVLAEQSRFSSAMYVSLTSGLNLTNAMKLSANTLSSLKHRSRVQGASKAIQGGESLSSAIESSSVLSSMDIGYLEIGEETGDLAASFNEIRVRKIEAFNLKLNSLLKILEPLLILIMGVLVGGVVIIMMLSILSVQDVAI